MHLEVAPDNEVIGGSRVGQEALLGATNSHRNFVIPKR